MSLKNRRKAEKLEIGNAGDAWVTLKLRFGDRMEWLPTEIENNPELAADTKTLTDLMKVFGIKKFYQIQADLKSWASRIKKTDAKYACVDCGRSYTTELGCKYHVNGRCPKNISKYRCQICHYEVLETAKIECKH